jgi:uncharacterized protein
MTLTVVLLLSLSIGVSLGLLGGGGSILTVPILVYVAGQDAKTAIATSLLVVGVTSAAGVISHARAGRVRWRTGLIFGGAGMVGAYGGGRVAEFIPGTALLVAFGLMMIVTSVAMLRGRREVTPERTSDDLPVGRILLEGAVVGAVTGLVGAGGGFLVVPALVLLGGLPMATAVGTSLLVIALKSGAGLLGYLASTPIDWELAGLVTAAAVVGSVAGGRLAGRIPETALRRAFGWFVLVMAVVVLVQELPDALRDALVGSPVTWVVLVLLAAAVAVVLRRRRFARPVDVDPARVQAVAAHADDEAERPDKSGRSLAETAPSGTTTADPTGTAPVTPSDTGAS